jgi:endonuclease/exonuclease/phosphatase family metal-dependent hydrolase
MPQNRGKEGMVMSDKRCHISHWKYVIVLCLIISFASADAFAWEGNKEFFFHRGRPLKVMTQNLYVGTDITQIAKAESVEQIPQLVTKAYGILVQTNFERRAEAIADQIEKFLPDLIGLQEVYFIRKQEPGDFLQFDLNGNLKVVNPFPNADLEDFDYLKILLHALLERGLDYETVAVVENIDTEMPMFAGIEAGIPIFSDVRITDYDVILARKHVKITDVVENNFSNNYAYNIGGLPILSLRGYCSVLVKIRGRTYRFINTHLELRNRECNGSECQQLQAQELTTELVDEKHPIILVGDFNSDPNDPPTQAYAEIQVAGYADVWTRRWQYPEIGETCCWDEELTTGDLYERVDHIFVRNDLGFLPFSIVGPVLAWRVGLKPVVEINPDLWLYPSDHAGVAAKLRVPRMGFRHYNR